MVHLLEGVRVDVHVGDGVEHGQIAEKREDLADDVPHLHFSQTSCPCLSHLVIFESMRSRMELTSER